MVDISLILKIFDVVAVGIQVASNIVQLVNIKGFHMPTLVSTIITIIVGLAIIFADFNILSGYVRYFGFVVPYIGRGITLIFLAVLLWVNPDKAILPFILNLIILIAGACYLIFGLIGLFRGGSSGAPSADSKNAHANNRV